MCFEYDGFPKMQNERAVKRTRKPHQCTSCGRGIPVGSPALYSSGVMDGEFYSFYVCEGCQRLSFTFAADEIRRGCKWHQAWCSWDELHDHARECRFAKTMPPLLEGTLEECYQQVVRAAELAKVEKL